MKRRDFIQRLPVMTAGLASGISATTMSGCAGTPYLVPRVSPQGLVFAASELGEGGGAFIQASDMERPIYVRRLEGGTLVAVLASCTHRGCQPEPIGDRV